MYSAPTASAPGAGQRADRTVGYGRFEVPLLQFGIRGAPLVGLGAGGDVAVLLRDVHTGRWALALLFRRKLLGGIVGAGAEG
jgi:hypothetical protein